MDTLIALGLIAASGWLGGKLLLGQAVVLHEFGHLAMAKLVGLPVRGVVLGGGDIRWQWRMGGINWTIRKGLSQGCIRVPNMTLHTTKGWRAVQCMALAGPGVNLVIVSCLIGAALAENTVGYAMGCAAVGWPHLRTLFSATSDIEMFRAAWNRDQSVL